MAILDNGKGILIGVGLGIGAAAVLGRGFLVELRKSARPMAKAALKSGILFFEKTKESLAELTEDVEDMFAEVEAELREDAEAEASRAEEEAVATPSPRRKTSTSQRKATGKKPRRTKKTTATKKA